MQKLNLLAIPGSLRVDSSSNAILSFAVRTVPETIHFSVYQNLANIPPFDDSANVPKAVVEFRQKLTCADGILICQPEYAFGISGVLKNALDWTVSSGDLVNKPVAVVTAATGGEKAHAALLLVLSALSARVRDDATLLIPFIKTKLDGQRELRDIETRQKVKSVMQALILQLN